MKRGTRGLLRAPAAALLGFAVLAGVTGCSGSGSASSSPQAGAGTGSQSSAQSSGQSSAQTQDQTQDQSQSTAPSPSLPVPRGIALTPQGTYLPLGRGATVAWQPDQHTVAVIRLTVTRQERVPISTFRDFRLDRATRRSTPYFVHATVKNMGRSDLGGVPVPLYLLDHRHTLLQASTFQAKFPACPSRPLPSGFGHGSRTTACLVYFVPRHGTLVSMSFRPWEDYDPITWHGPVRSRSGTR